MSYALKPLDSELNNKTTVALNSISELLKSSQSPPPSIVQSLVQTQDGSTSPLLAALSSILHIRNTSSNVESDWIFSTICTIIERVLDTTPSTSLSVDIMCLCGSLSSPDNGQICYLTGDVVTLLYMTLQHNEHSSLFWQITPLDGETAQPIHNAWSSILTLILSLLFSPTPRELQDVAIFKAGWIVSLIASKVLIIHSPPLIFPLE